jgi:hypothetical protein
MEDEKGSSAEASGPQDTPKRKSSAAVGMTPNTEARLETKSRQQLMQQKRQEMEEEKRRGDIHGVSTSHYVPQCISAAFSLPTASQL